MNSNRCYHPRMTKLTLRNPHSILAVFQHRPQDVLSVRVKPQAADSAWTQVVDLARQHGISVLSQRPAPSAGGRRGGGKRRDKTDGRTGAGEADVRPREDVAVKPLFAHEGDAGLWLAFDHLQDPHNVGAIFRTAAFFGVRGIVMTKDRSAPLTGDRLRRCVRRDGVGALQPAGQSRPVDRTGESRRACGCSAPQNMRRKTSAKSPATAPGCSSWETNRRACGNSPKNTAT